MGDVAFETVEVPFMLVGNRPALTDEQIYQSPCLADFLDRFRACFERDENRSVWFFDAEGNGG